MATTLLLLARGKSWRSSQAGSLVAGGRRLPEPEDQCYSLVLPSPRLPRTILAPYFVENLGYQFLVLVTNDVPHRASLLDAGQQGLSLVQAMRLYLTLGLPNCRDSEPHSNTFSTT